MNHTSFYESFLNSDAVSWVTQVFIVLFIAGLLNLIQYILLNKFNQRLKDSLLPWDPIFVISINKPLTLFIWVIGISYASEIIALNTDFPLIHLIEGMRDLMIIFSMGWFLIRLISNTEARVLEKRTSEGSDIHTVAAIAKLFRVSVIITTVLVMLQTAGFSIAGVLTFGGIGGIAIGFAAKDLLANFFGGIIIYLDRPFTIGDNVSLPSIDIEGNVEYIGWRLTCIRTFDKKPVYIPNSTFSSIAVVNPSRRTHREIKETIGLCYEDIDQMEVILKKLNEFIQNNESLAESKVNSAHFVKFSESSLDIIIYAHTPPSNLGVFLKIKQQLLLDIAKIIKQEGADFAFPSQTVYIKEQNK